MREDEEERIKSWKTTLRVHVCSKSAATIQIHHLSSAINLTTSLFMDQSTSSKLDDELLKYDKRVKLKELNASAAPSGLSTAASSRTPAQHPYRILQA
jgi:hypothetical protein